MSDPLMCAWTPGPRQKSKHARPSKFERVEIVTCSPLDFRAGKHGDVAAAVVIEVFDAPLSGAIAVFMNGNLAMKRVAYRHVFEALAVLHPRPLGGIFGGDHILKRSRSGLVWHYLLSIRVVRRERTNLLRLPRMRPSLSSP